MAIDSQVGEGTRSRSSSRGRSARSTRARSDGSVRRAATAPRRRANSRARSCSSRTTASVAELTSEMLNAAGYDSDSRRLGGSGARHAGRWPRHRCGVLRRDDAGRDERRGPCARDQAAAARPADDAGDRLYRGGADAIAEGLEVLSSLTNSRRFPRSCRATFHRGRRARCESVSGRRPGICQEPSAARRMDFRARSRSAAVVAQLLTLTRMASRPRQRVPPHQHSPASWSRPIVALVRGSLPKAATTWFRTTSFRTSTPARCSSAPSHAAWSQLRSTSPASPRRPSDWSAAQTSKPRARREPSVVRSMGSCCRS